MAAHQNPFQFLHDKFSILLVDDDPSILRSMSTGFARLNLFDVALARNVKEAVNMIKTRPRWHGIVLDLGIADAMHDEFYLLREFALSTPVLMHSGNQLAAKTVECMRLGAVDVVQKGTENDEFGPFAAKFCHYVMLASVNPHYCGHCHPTLRRATEILIKSKTDNVADWARACGLTDRALRHIWKKHVGLPAKQAVDLGRMLRAAFAGCLAPFVDNCDVPWSSPDADARRLSDKYWVNRSAYDRILFTKPAHTLMADDLAGAVPARYRNAIPS